MIAKPLHEETAAAAPPRNLVIDKRALLEKIDALNKRVGFVRDETVTVEQVRAMMIADGIRPEENVFSRDIIRARYEDEDKA